VSRSIISLLSLLFGPSLVPQQDLARVEGPDSISISGKVIDGQTQKVLAGVKLFLFEPSAVKPGSLVKSPAPVAESGSEGKFRFAVSKPGRYLVSPNKDGFVYPRRRSAPAELGVWLTAQSNQRVDDLEIPMVKEGTIAGRLVDPRGQPVADVPVALLEYNYDDDSGRRRLISAGMQTNGIRTNDLGEYRFIALPPGEYFVYAGMTMGRWSRVYYPGTTDEKSATALVVKPGEELRLHPITLVERQTVNVTLAFPGTPAAEAVL
jgi:hypothetical protein